MCQIITETETEITCLTPEKKNRADYDEPVPIYVTGKLIEESITECEPSATCTFHYQTS